MSKAEVEEIKWDGTASLGQIKQPQCFSVLYPGMDPRRMLEGSVEYNYVLGGVVC